MMVEQKSRGCLENLSASKIDFRIQKSIFLLNPKSINVSEEGWNISSLLAHYSDSDFKSKLMRIHDPLR